MPEILTESFCERCGTRYTFESAASRTAKLKGIRVLSRGLKNFVMSDDTSMDEAMAAARSETDREATTQQLDAFHKTFNFCMNCRQYTCGNCWNEAEGQCLTCAPHLGHEILPAPFPDLDATAGIAGLGAIDGNGANGHLPETAPGPMAWPTSDLMRDAEAAEPRPAVEPATPSMALPVAEADAEAEPVEAIDAVARLAALGAAPEVESGAAEAVEPTVVEPTVEPVMETIAPPVEAAPVEAAPVEAELVESEPVEAAPVIDDPEAEIPHATDGRAAVAASQTTDLLRRFRPGQSLDDEIAAFEREHAAAEAAAIAAAAAAAAPDPVPAEPEIVGAQPEVVAVEPEHVVAGPELVAVEPEPVAVEPEPVVPQPEPVAAEAPPPVPAVDVVPQPTWQIVAPESPTADGVPAPAIPQTPAPSPDAEPQWPTRPEWPSHQPSAGLPFLARTSPTNGLDSLWAESAREVTAAMPAAAATRPTTGVAPCVSCGLSLSATARFCRRCGTRQG